MVLVVVAVLIAMISLAGLAFVMLMSTESHAVYLHGDQIRAQHLVGSGVEQLKSFLGQSPQARRAAGGCYDNAAVFRGVLACEDPAGVMNGRFTVLAPRLEDDDVTGLRFGAANESARLNLGVLLDWEADHPGSGRAALMELPEMTESIADAILDWMDADGEPREFGAEADAYSGEGLPYEPRNAPPEFLDELLLVRGVTRELLHGFDENFNHHIEPHERAAASRAAGSLSESELPWGYLLTVYSAERNVDDQGGPRIHLNDNDLSALHRALRDAFETAWADFIVLYRQYGPHTGSHTHAQDSIPEPDLSLSATFTIESRLDLIGAAVRIPASGSSQTERIVLSPFAEDPPAMREYLPELLDRTTITDTEVIRGRVNVNEAPRIVLRAVPGMDSALVEEIVAARRMGDADEQPVRRFPHWVLAEELVSRETMKALEPYLTGGGDVYRAQVVGFFDRQGPSARAEVVVDATGERPRQVYWKDMRLLGRGYPLASLGARAEAPEEHYEPAEVESEWLEDFDPPVPGSSSPGNEEIW